MKFLEHLGAILIPDDDPDDPIPVSTRRRAAGIGLLCLAAIMIILAV